MKYNATSIPYSATGVFSSLVNDYISGNGTARDYVPYTPNLEGIKKAIQQRKFSAIQRQKLVSVLENQYQVLGTLTDEKNTAAFEKVQANIGLLKNDNCFAVTTAHQPNLFTGPLYFFYKIIHVIKLAAELNTAVDEATLTSDTMKAVFDQMRTMRGFVDSNFSGRDWNLATAMVMNGEAAFQIMGDWAKGEFLAAGKQPGKDFLCASTPGEGFLYNVDSFAMFDVAGDDKTAGQLLLAELIVGKNFQKVFNLNKGSIPARTDVALDEFDSCAHTSAKDMADSNAGGSLLPSYAHGMALRGAQSGAITDVVTSHFNSDMSSDDAVQMLLQAVQNSM